MTDTKMRLLIDRLRLGETINSIAPRLVERDAAIDELTLALAIARDVYEDKDASRDEIRWANRFLTVEGYLDAARH